MDVRVLPIGFKREKEKSVLYNILQELDRGFSGDSLCCKDTALLWEFDCFPSSPWVERVYTSVASRWRFFCLPTVFCLEDGIYLRFLSGI